MSEAFSKYCNENNINFREIDTEVKAKFWFESGQRHLPESVEAVLSAARRAKALLDHKIHGEGEVSLVDIFDVLYVSLRNHNKGRE